MSLKVAVVSHSAVVSINQEPFDALARAGAHVTVFAPRSLRTDIRGLVRLSILPGSAAEVVGLPVHLGGHARVLGGQRGIHLIVYGGLTRALRDARPDVVFVEEEPFSLAAAQSLRAAAGIPVVVHENQNIARRLPPPFQQIRRKVLRSVAGLTLRNAAAEQVVRSLGYEGPVCPFPHAVDPSRYPPAGGAEGVIGFVGRLVPEKGIFDLIEATAGIPGARLLVVGDGPSRGEAEARAAAAGIEAVFTGALRHDLVPAEYARMSVVAVPSRTTPTWKEQFGRVVLEANAAGLPVVVSDSGELPATVEATGGGVVVREGDAAALSVALRALLADPGAASEMGRAARAEVEARFTPEAISTELLRFLREVSA